jgi:hypothetical protein
MAIELYEWVRIHSAPRCGLQASPATVSSFHKISGSTLRDAGTGEVATMRRAKEASNEKQELKERLAKYREIDLTVVGRQTGRKSSRPVWFVMEGNKFYLLPVTGSDTQWYKNALRNPSIRIDARGAGAQFQVKPIRDPAVVNSIVEKFREKYGAADVKKYYSKLDVAVEVDLS